MIDSKGNEYVVADSISDAIGNETPDIPSNVKFISDTAFERNAFDATKLMKLSKSIDGLIGAYELRRDYPAQWRQI